jgi:hypothetical protein
MSLLSRIFGTKSEATEKASAALASTPEFDRLLAFGSALMRLLNEDRYIARSDYKPIVEEYTDIKTFFLNLQVSNLLGMYCEKNGLDEERIKKALALFKELENLKTRSSRRFTSSVRYQHSIGLDTQFCARMTPRSAILKTKASCGASLRTT